MNKPIKIMLLGDSSVGKSCLMYQYCNGTFVASYISTVGIDFQVKTLQINDTSVKVQVWDTAGQEQFHTINYAYYRGADGIILVYDVCNRSSFENISKWLKDIEKFAQSNVTILLVGNKLDLADRRQISHQEGQDLAQKYNTSAKTSKNVDEAFLLIVQKIYYKLQAENELNPGAKSNQNKVELNQRNVDRISVKQCCP